MAENDTSWTPPSLLDMRHLFDLYSFSSMRRFLVLTVGHDLEVVSESHLRPNGCVAQRSWIRIDPVTLRCITGLR